MSEYIKREDVLRIMRRAFDFDYNEETAVENLPAADVVEVRHGHWVYGSQVDPIGSHGAECSVCGGYTEDNSEYCGCCGARMDDELQRKYDDYFEEGDKENER